MAAVICWFHQDLRLGDHPALSAAIASGHDVIPLYIHDQAAAGDWAMGGASGWWLHHSLADLSMALKRAGSSLTIRQGKAETVLDDLVKETGTAQIFTHSRGEPWSKIQLQDATAMAQSLGVSVTVLNGCFLTNFGDVLSKTGNRMKVFTPYKRNLLALNAVREVLPRPDHIKAPAVWPKSDALDELGLLPQKPDWSGGLKSAWRVGEAAALQRLEDFLSDAAQDYHVSRDQPSIEGTSRLSPHLHFGEISPVTIYHAVMEQSDGFGAVIGQGPETFLSEVIWREFSYELIDQCPTMPEAPLRDEFARFPWAENYADDLTAWQKGQTGYPLIDAGMRELYETGWMHNRVRMITASFLTKHLLVPWQEGARWFFDTLVDADLASNSAGWQWVAGCGADASPYFRVFNPITQGTKFDAGAYVRKWCPELRELDDKLLFAPFDAPDVVLMGAGVKLGQNYPHPLISHPQGRQRALDAYKSLKER